MSILVTSIALVTALAVYAFSWWKERQYQPGNPPLIPLIYVQISALIVALVLAAHLISITTGLVWEPPFRR